MVAARSLLTLLMLVLAGILTGCANPLVIVPDDVGEQGLLVAQVAAHGIPDIGGNPVITPKEGQVQTHIGGLRGDTLIVPLNPGEYEFSSLSKAVASSSVSTGYGTMHQTTYRLYPVQRKFRIEPGQATNLGLLVFVPVEGRRIVVLHADNHNDLERFLLDRYESTYKSLRAKPPMAYSDIPRLTEPQLQTLRKALAAYELKRREGEIKRSRAELIAGPAGTIARVGQDANANLVVKEVLATPTVTDLTGCSGTATRLACVTGPGHFLLADYAGVRELTAPEGVRVNSAHAFGERGVVLADDNLRLFTSLDNGSTWRTFDGAARAKPFDCSRYRGIALNHVGFVNGREGFYVFERGGNSLFYGGFTNASYRAVPVPKTASDIKKVVETPQGLYIAPAYTDFAKGKLHYRAGNAQDWAVFELPKSGCNDMRVDDGAGNRIDIACQANFYRSEDGGRTWKSVFQAQSMFH